ncbi:MAG: hypothetical protein ABSD31_02800 [Candidatus Binataceae bacterium]|jgi:hypothetical protein
MNKSTGLVAYGLFFSGVSLIMLSALGAELWHWPIWGVAFVRDIGLLLSAVMAGTMLHEKLLRDETFRSLLHELDRKLETKIPKLDDIASRTANGVHELFCQRPPGLTGMRLGTAVRRNFEGYSNWITQTKPQELFFAGRSVLHRIDAHIRSRTASCAEDILLRRLKEGSQIKVLFLDPRTGIVERIAAEEGQTLQAMLGDVTRSLGICLRLDSLLQTEFAALPANAELSIRVYDRIPYFAYHKQGDDVLVGFYFLSYKGSTSAAYELVDDVTKEVFGDHFAKIHSETTASSLVEFEGARGRPAFNGRLVAELRHCLSEKLGTDKVDELLSRENVEPLNRNIGNRLLESR